MGSSRRLDAETFNVLGDPAHDVLFSAVSIWEIAIKFALGRGDFAVSPDDILQGARQIGFAELPVSSGTAATVAKLPLLHRDPFDRLLLAQAIAEPALLYTADARLPAYSHLIRRIAAP